MAVHERMRKKARRPRCDDSRKTLQKLKTCTKAVIMVLIGVGMVFYSVI